MKNKKIIYPASIILTGGLGIFFVLWLERKNQKVIFSTIGAVIGTVLFWPSIIDPLSFSNVMDIIELGISHSDFKKYLVPWILKILICSAVGLAVGIHLQSKRASFPK